MRILMMIIVFMIAQSGFKAEQKKYPRVRQAYDQKWEVVNDLLNKNKMQNTNLRVYLRAFKQEEIIEVWAKNKSEAKYTLIEVYDVCDSSGELGPKREQGDQQVPEGFYHIDRFNPVSNFHLSLGINYPNHSDRIKSGRRPTGGDIFIHGNCVTIGCLPITDDKIKELYILCIEAKNAGQKTIPVSIFPRKLEKESYEELLIENYKDEDKVGLWIDLKKAYDYFNEKKKLPSISFLANGRHRIS